MSRPPNWPTRWLQVREYSDAAEKQGGPPRAFFAIRKDGSAEDFSYLKCASALFPGQVNWRNTDRGEGLCAANLNDDHWVQQQQ